MTTTAPLTTTDGDIYPEVYRAEFERLTAAGVSRVDAADQATRVAARAELAWRDAVASPAGQSGWCAAHPGDDHLYSTSCVGFVPDAEHTAQMLREAAEHDRHVQDAGAEARYVEQHHPY